MLPMLILIAIYIQALWTFWKHCMGELSQELFLSLMNTYAIPLGDRMNSGHGGNPASDLGGNTNTLDFHCRQSRQW